MSHLKTFIDCRGLSAPLTVLRIKQAMVGRSDVGLPLDVLIDSTCGDHEKVAASLTGEPADIRLLLCSEQDLAAMPVTTTAEAPHAHV